MCYGLNIDIMGIRVISTESRSNLIINLNFLSQMALVSFGCNFLKTNVNKWKIFILFSLTI